MAAPSKCASRNALIDQPLGEPSKSPSERPTRRVGESFAYMYEGRDMSHVDDGLNVKDDERLRFSLPLCVHIA